MNPEITVWHLVNNIPRSEQFRLWIALLSCTGKVMVALGSITKENASAVFTRPPEEELRHLLRNVAGVPAISRLSAGRRLERS